MWRERYVNEVVKRDFRRQYGLDGVWVKPLRTPHYVCTLPTSEGAAFTVALGLRTLTLQTGDALRSRLGLGEDELAVLIVRRQLINCGNRKNRQ